MLARHAASGFPASVVRPAAIYGPDNNIFDMETPMFLRLIQHRPVLVPHGGLVVGSYGHVDDLCDAMITIASPYAIWVLKQASDKLPLELDEAARIDGASPLQLFRLVYVPLMAPSLVAVGVYALLLAWNEYLYAFLLLSNERDVTLAVALGLFLSADDSPWELLMTTGLLYALPPAAIYYVFKRYMQSGLTAGAVKA